MTAFFISLCTKLYNFAHKFSNKILTMNNMPTVTKNLLIINILFFAGRYVASLYNINLDDILGLHFFLAKNFHYYQLFTYMFMHGGLEHIFFNMFAVWMFGRIMEQTMGARRFLFYYLTCGLGAGLIQEIAQFGEYLYSGYNAYEQVNMNGMIVEMSDYLNRWTTVGASGAVYGILLSFGMTYPNERLFIFPLPVPIKAKFFVIGYAVIELLSALCRSSEGVAHFAHLGGMLVGFLLLLYWKNGGGHRKKYDRNNPYNTRRNFSLKDYFHSLTNFFKKEKGPHITIQKGGKFASDMEYNRKKKQNQEEIDHILEKIKKHGYASLTEEEKTKLFNASHDE